MSTTFNEPSESLSDRTTFLIERVCDQYDELIDDGMEVMIHTWNDGYRLRFRPNFEETGQSYETDIGPYCDTEEEFQLFLRGLTMSDAEIEAKGELFDE